jgi:hypothetical protein
MGVDEECGDQAADAVKGHSGARNHVLAVRGEGTTGSPGCPGGRIHPGATLPPSTVKNQITHYR